MKLSHEAERFMKRARWVAQAHLNKDKFKNSKEKYGFPTQKKPDATHYMKDFEDEVAKLVGSIKWQDYTNDFQQNQMKEDIRKINESTGVLMEGDKSYKFWEIDPLEHDKLIEKNVQKDYKKCGDEAFNDVNKEDKDMATKLGISDRVFKTSKREAKVKLKDYKEDFKDKMPVRLLNPTKQELGKASKKVLEKIVSTVREKTGLNHWKNTSSVLQWFDKIQNKEKYNFITWDINDFYGSITEDLLRRTIEWAENFIEISDEHKELIFHVRKTFLFHKNQGWVKKDNENFDVAMGSHDSAEVCEIVGLFLLKEVREEDLNIIAGGYRDDFLAISDKTPAQNEHQIKNKIYEIFRQNGFKITIKANLKILDFLDVTLDLTTGIYKPYCKPNNTPVYVNAKSNHHPNVIKAIPLGVNKRLNMISANEEVFKEKAPM